MRPINKTYESRIFRSEIEQEHTMWWNWYYDYTDNSYYDQFDDYSYIDKDLEKEILTEVLQGPCSRKRKWTYYAYRIVDMESFYSKEVLREKRINDLLGLPGGTYRTKKPTLGDLIKKDVYNT
jgi:hypothetical protein